MKDYRSIVVLTGAGISAESGIKTFRDGNGLWENHSIEEVATPEGFLRNPELVHKFYNQRRQQLLTKEVQPNPAHYALAKLEENFKGNFLLITQNVDDLHERAGSQKLIHMHGELLKVRCLQSGQVYTRHTDVNFEAPCLCCRERRRLRPHIVWFGETPFEMGRLEMALSSAELFVSIGTSGNVYPAAGFVGLAKRAGAETVEINLEPSEGYSYFKTKKYGKASELVPAFVDELGYL